MIQSFENGHQTEEEPQMTKVQPPSLNTHFQKQIDTAIN
jgi:hypothetical protein